MREFAQCEKRFLDPNADFLRYRAQMDAGLREIAGFLDSFEGMTDEAYRAFFDKAFADKTIDKYMPDSSYFFTYYPNYAYQDGSIPNLHFDFQRRCMIFELDGPAQGHSNTGPRLSFG